MNRFLLGLLAFGCLCSQPVLADTNQLQALLSSPDRAQADRERDQRDKAAEVMGVINLKAGDKVMDVFAGGGYWSELFAAAVGTTGQVFVHNNAAYRKYVGPKVHERFRARPLPQVVLYDREVTDLELKPASLSAIFMAMSFHDLYFVDAAQDWPAIDADGFIDQLAASLDAGGRLIILDHTAAPGTGVGAAQELHRIEPEAVQRILAAHGFKLVTRSALLENSTDPLTVSVFDPAIRGKTSRFLLVFEKTGA